MRAAVSKADAQRAAVEETNRLLLASQSILMTALGQYQQAVADTDAIADTYRELCNRQAGTAARFRESADGFAQVIGNYRDIIAQAATPDDLSSLTGDE
ncbi:MAG: hypothetical protein PHQ28_00565 [Mycobacterium sp.]|nr:hypothetical protein [Mycobacterium sp.]